MTQICFVADCTDQVVRHLCHRHCNFGAQLGRMAMCKALPDLHLTHMASLDLCQGPAAYPSIAKLMAKIHVTAYICSQITFGSICQKSTVVGEDELEGILVIARIACLLIVDGPAPAARPCLAMTGTSK